MNKKCPKCGSKHLGDRWVNGRKLSQYCRDCDWVGLPRIPELMGIKDTKDIVVGHFPGFHYDVFDRYGHMLIASRFFDKESDAEKALIEEIERGKKDKNAGPYTGILWPYTATVKGRRFV